MKKLWKRGTPSVRELADAVSRPGPGIGPESSRITCLLDHTTCIDHVPGEALHRVARQDRVDTDEGEIHRREGPRI